MRTQETPEPTPTPAPANENATERIINEIIDFYTEEPALVIFTSLLGAIAITFLMFGVVYAISRAGHFQPPRVVLSVITGLVAMLAIIAVIVRPGVEALGVAVGTAIGGLVGALGTAYTDSTRRGLDGETPEPPEPIGPGPGEPVQPTDDGGEQLG